MGTRDDLPPDDLPRSPSGRVPRWVQDGDADVLSMDTARRRRRRPRFSWAALGGWAVAIAAIGVLVLSIVDGWVVLPWSSPSGAVDAQPRPPAGVEEGERPRGALDAPVPAPADGSFAYIGRQTDGTTPVTWSPCRPIHYVVRTTNASSDGPGLLRSALDEISRDSGLIFVDDGTTDENPSAARAIYQPDRYGERWAPVLISWVTEKEDPDMTSEVLGITRPRSSFTGDGTEVWVSGQVALNADLIATVQKKLGVKATRTVFLHELGHLVGLDHVQAAKAVMFPSYRASVVTFTPAEVEGLRSLGSGACHGDV